MILIGFYHEITRLDRNNYVDIDFEAIKQFEIAESNGRVTGKTQRQFKRCDQTKIGKKKGCQQIGTYDGDSIMHYPPTLTTQVIENGAFVDKTFTVFTLKEEAHALCKGGRCSPGQRDGLSNDDIIDIKTRYKTTCGK